MLLLLLLAGAAGGFCLHRCVSASIRWRCPPVCLVALREEDVVLSLPSRTVDQANRVLVCPLFIISAPPPPYPLPFYHYSSRCFVSCRFISFRFVSGCFPEFQFRSVLVVFGLVWFDWVRFRFLFVSDAWFGCLAFFFVPRFVSFHFRFVFDPFRFVFFPILFRFVSFRVSCRFVSFRVGSFRFVLCSCRFVPFRFRFVSFRVGSDRIGSDRFGSFRFVSVRFLSFRFRFRFPTSYCVRFECRTYSRVVAGR